MRNHVSSKPFKHIAVAPTLSTRLPHKGHTAFTQGFPQLSGAECLRCGLRLGLNPSENRLQGSLLSAGSNMRPSKRGENPKKLQTAGTRRVESQKLVKRPIWSSC